jgi:3-oxoacyl-[acyl-carrier-protein] synthase-3
MNTAYINSVGKFLPGEPVSNSNISNYIGPIHGVESRIRALVLRQNGIETRHYAIDENGRHLHTNAEMAGHAVRNALSHSEIDADRIGYLAAATTIGDLIVPGFASAVHAELDFPPIEIASFQSVCASGIMALKSAMLQIRSKECCTAAVVASELASRWFKPGFYETQVSQEEASKPDFSMEFLRWTLSDGAGAVILEDTPNERGTSLRIDWIEIKSYATRFDPCMYAGMDVKVKKNEKARYWGSYSNPGEAYENGALILAQDFKLLYEMFPVWIGYYLEILEKYNLKADDIHHFLPHYSAQSLREEMKKLLIKTGAMIPEERWHNNLKRCGNTGAAAIYIILDELVNEGTLKSGEKILCFIPESGRCLCAFMMLTVV